MSVRRLADETVQPTAFAFSPENQQWAERKMAEYPPGRQQSAVIPVLMRAQEQDGWVSRPAIEAVAKLLDMAYIRVLEVATFYTMFQLKPVGTLAHIQVCGTTLPSIEETGPCPSGEFSSSTHCFMIRIDWRISSMRHRYRS